MSNKHLQAASNHTAKMSVEGGLSSNWIGNPFTSLTTLFLPNKISVDLGSGTLEGLTPEKEEGLRPMLMEIHDRDLIEINSILDLINKQNTM